MNEVNFGGGNLSDDAYVAHDAPAETVALKANDITWPGMSQRYMNPCVVK